MTADDSKVADVGRMLAASAVLDLRTSEGRLAGPLRRLAGAPPAARVAGSRGGDDRTTRVLARALRTAATGRVSPAERAWVARVEERRRRLVEEGGTTAAVFSEVGPARKDDAASAGFDHVEREGPLAGKCETISVPPRWGVLLMRLVGELAPRVCVELGTGFGLSAAFIAAALELNGEGELTTFEGAEEWANVAREGATELGLEPLVVRVGPLSTTLPAALAELGPVDFAFVDAEHTKESTLRYFDHLQPHLSSRAVLVFDDIDFDSDMWAAWEEIRGHPRVDAWAALGRMGIVRVAAET